MKNPETTPQSPTPPEAPETKYFVELEYDMANGNLTMKSKAPTVIVSAIMRTAEFTVPVEMAVNSDGKKRLKIEYDMLTDTASVQSDTSPVITRGMLVMAFSMITQSQILQRLQGMQARAKIMAPAGAQFS